MNWIVITEIVLGTFAIAAHLADVLTTNKVLSQGGTEYTPGAGLAQKYFGSFWWVGAKAPFLAVAVLGYYGNSNSFMFALFAVGVVAAFAAWHNYRQIRK
jgi:hypothetical protein